MVSLKSALTTLLLLNTGLVLAQPNNAQDVLKHLSLPAGFSISIYADKLPLRFTLECACSKD